MRLTETEREVIRAKASQQGIDSVILYVERILSSRLAVPNEFADDGWFEDGA